MRVEPFDAIPEDGTFDFVVVGSGFGGSVAALRLAEKGWRVAVLEAGRHFADEDFAETNWDARRYLWAPRLGCRGPQRLTLLDHALILSGAGVGGGSLVYANTLLEPPAEFYARAPVARACPDLRERLAPAFATARRMLGAAPAPRLFAADRDLESLARASGRESSFRRADVGVFFGDDGRDAPDPYFGGEGPPRRGCVFCGGCITGCRKNAKNTLAKNYLPLAARRGARIFELARALSVSKAPSGGFVVEAARSGWSLARKTVRTRRVVLSAGVLGTLRLLLDGDSRLPGLSARVGRDVRTNAEALTAVSSFGEDRSRGLAIAAGYREADGTHVEAVRFGRGSGLMSLLALRAPQARGLAACRAAAPWGWASRTTLLLFMGPDQSRLRVRLGAFGLRSEPEPGSTVPRAPACAPAATRRLAALTRGADQRSISELVGASTTAHILGGAAMSASPEEGVVAPDGRAHGVGGLWVLDGSILPANLGVNPSLTIAALAEHAMSLVPAKGAA